MFSLHERTQRYLCRFAFFPLCVVPTLFVVWWCVWSNLSTRVDELAQEWSSSLGLEVSIQKLSTPQPGLVRLHGVQLRDAITNEEIASCPMLTLVRKEERWNVSMAHVEVKEAGLPSLWRVLQESVETRPGHSSKSVHVEIDDLTIAGDGRSLQLAGLEYWTLPHLIGRKASLEFKRAFSGNENMIHVDCVRQDDTAGGTSRWNWSVLTGDSSLPAYLLAHFLPELEHLGSSCKIRGRLHWDTTGDGSEGRFSGAFSGIDLTRLAAVANLGAMTGRGRIDVESAVFRDGVLTEANARLASKAGSVDSSLLRKIDLLLTRQIHSRQGHSSFGTAGGVLQFEQLAVKMSTASDQDGWRLQGDCENALPGALMIDSLGEVVLRHTAEQASRPFSHGDVVAVFADPKSLWVPLSDQTRWLLDRLPLTSSSHAEDEDTDVISRRPDPVAHPR